MRKIVINGKHGGFGLSTKAKEYLRCIGVVEISSLKRDDKRLCEAVTLLGSCGASGQHAELKIIEIPEDIEWELNEYDGLEWVAEKHRRWY